MTPHRILIADIQRVVARDAGLDVAALLRCDRHHAVSHPRQIAMYLSRRLTRHSFPEIAKRFGGLHHTSVLHAVRAVQQRAKADPDMGRRVGRLAREVKGR